MSNSVFVEFSNDDEF